MNRFQLVFHPTLHLCPCHFLASFIREQSDCKAYLSLRWIEEKKVISKDNILLCRCPLGLSQTNYWQVEIV